MSGNATVFVVDDEPAMQRSLAFLLNKAGYEVRTFDSAEDFLGISTPKQPSCLLVDVRLRGISGLDLQRELNARAVRIPMIVISGYAEVPTAVKAMKQGAMDFLEKPFQEDALLTRVAAAIRKSEAICRGVSIYKEGHERLERISPREREVCELLVEGLNTKRIASKLGISPKTVEKHRISLLQKLDFESVVELVRWWFSPE